MRVIGMFTMGDAKQEELRTATAEGFISEAETGMDGLSLWIMELRSSGHEFDDGHGILTGKIVQQSVRRAHRIRAVTRKSRNGFNDP